MKFNTEIVKKGFEKLYREVLKSNLTEKNWENIQFIFSCIEFDSYWSDYRQVANFLAQCGHESMWKYAPISEVRARRGTALYDIQNKYWDTGFYGRGIIQLTHALNYKKMSKYVGIDLVKYPNKLIEDAQVSYTVAAKGMQEGIFTGKKLSDFIVGERCDYLNARKIVNGMDRAKDIEFYSKCIDSVLKKALIEGTPTFTIDDETVDAETSTALASTDANSPAAVIEANIPVPTTAFQSLKAYYRHVIALFGISGTGAVTWFSGFMQSNAAKYTLIGIIVFLVLISLVLAINHLWIKHDSEMRREQRAHELTLKELEIRADPNMQNVEVRK